MPNTKLPLKILPKTFRVLPKWQKFAKSGHTESAAQAISSSSRAALQSLTFSRVGERERGGGPSQGVDDCRES